MQNFQDVITSLGMLATLIASLYAIYKVVKISPKEVKSADADLSKKYLELAESSFDRAEEAEKAYKEKIKETEAIIMEYEKKLHGLEQDVIKHEKEIAELKIKMGEKEIELDILRKKVLEQDVELGELKKAVKNNGNLKKV